MIADNLTFLQTDLDKIRWEEVNYSTVSVFQTSGWVNYLGKAGIKVRVEVILLEEEEIGFILFSERRLGFLKHLGSPLPGTGTGFGGIVLYETATSGYAGPTFSISEIYLSLMRYASKRASYFSITDLNLAGENLDTEWPDSIKITSKQHYFLDLSREWDEIYRSFKDKSCRYEYRKGLKNGLSVSFGLDISSFITHHFKHISNVYNRKGLVPTFSRNRLQYIAESLYPDNVLLGVCLNENKEPVASCIIVFNEYCAFLTTAACLDLWLGKGANEFLMVQCIQEVRNRGAKKMEFGGGMKYKEKYGTVPLHIPTIEYSASYNPDYEVLKSAFRKIRKRPLVKTLIRWINN